MKFFLLAYLRPHRMDSPRELNKKIIMSNIKTSQKKLCLQLPRSNGLMTRLLYFIISKNSRSRTLAARGPIKWENWTALVVRQACCKAYLSTTEIAIPPILLPQGQPLFATGIATPFVFSPRNPSLFFVCTKICIKEPLYKI